MSEDLGACDDEDACTLDTCTCDGDDASCANAVAPDGFPCDYSPNDWSTSLENPENYQRRQEATPLGRLCEPHDVANAFLFAASDEASMITGSMITVDGGAGI